MNQCNCVSKFLFDHIISYVGELFVLAAYHSIDDYQFNVFIVDLGSKYVTGETIRMIMAGLPMFSYNFAYTIMSDILY